MCGASDGTFVTLFHTKKEEPLEKIAKAFFGRRWENLKPETFASLPVSRFLAASIVTDVAEQAFSDFSLRHYPNARVASGMAPLFSSGRRLWIGYRYFSEGAYEWARANKGQADRVVALYFADTKYQFLTVLPPGTEAMAISEVDAKLLGGRNEDLIRVLLRNLEVPATSMSTEKLTAIVTGFQESTQVPVSAADVHEAHAVLRTPCKSKDDLRYQLAAAVVLTTWIEAERKAGFKKRRKFYAFKTKVEDLAHWVESNRPPGVIVWAERLKATDDPVLYIRVDDVDFSFHAIPYAYKALTFPAHCWKGVRLKLIAPIVLAWARCLRSEKT